MSAKFLKIKVKCLAAEAKFIRKEERECKTLKVEVPVKDRDGKVLRMKTIRKLKARKVEMFNALRNHRIGVVRKEARNTLIAYAFVRNKPYTTTAPKDKRLVDVESVRRMTRKYGPADLQYLSNTHEAVVAYVKKLDAWFVEGDEHFFDKEKTRE